MSRFKSQSIHVMHNPQETPKCNSLVIFTYSPTKGGSEMAQKSW